VSRIPAGVADIFRKRLSTALETKNMIKTRLTRIVGKWVLKIQNF
jgi:hypothetical protein